MSKLITQEGLEKLQEELKNRKTEVRQSIALSIKEAKEQGDLSENAEYSEAKNQQSENEARIAELEVLIKNAEVVKHDKATSDVEVGSSVDVQFRGNKVTFHIVGSNEADPVEFKISNESPMGEAFIGKKKGDVVTVETPKGEMEYEILDVK